jgi:hypothetical protein
MRSGAPDRHLHRLKSGYPRKNKLTAKPQRTQRNSLTQTIEDFACFASLRLCVYAVKNGVQG